MTKLKEIIQKYKEDIDQFDFSGFAKEIACECGAPTLKKISAVFNVDLATFIAPSYIIIEDVVFSADKKTLVNYPPEKTDTTYQIPSSVKTVKDKAFQGNEYLTEITIPDTVCHIGSEAFCNCNHLAKVFWGQVTSAGSRVFVNCPELKEVYVECIESLWECQFDNFGSPCINGAVLYVNQTPCDKIFVPTTTKGCIHAFQGCISIKHITFEENNNYIEQKLLDEIKKPYTF